MLLRSESLYVYLMDPNTEESSAAMGVPMTRVPLGGAIDIALHRTAIVSIYLPARPRPAETPRRSGREEFLLHVGPLAYVVIYSSGLKTNQAQKTSKKGSTIYPMRVNYVR